ncbi:MAG TPA: zinc ribbon domain-containing protein [Thermoanaerobaculia bacterium]|nr:zinc ribbon domain-containing protein [Thermoanaerobaculia bacterium]
MPIYELYCADCDTLFNFFSPTVDTTTRPPCPRCGERTLERRPARFATLTRSTAAGGDEAAEDDPFRELGVDEERLGAAFESAMAEIEGSGDAAEDPRQVARLFRRVGESAGLEPGPQMEEMLRRLEAGDDPDRLEEEMGDAFDGGEGEEGDPLAELFRKKRPRGGRRRPRVDEELYFF